MSEETRKKLLEFVDAVVDQALFEYTKEYFMSEEEIDSLKGLIQQKAVEETIE